MFEQIIGNEPNKKYLEKALLENRLGQTVLFSGMEGIGKSLFAGEVASQILKGNRFDFHAFSPEGKSGLYSIETIREMIDLDRAAPFSGNAKVFVLEDVDQMLPASANALLKTLEEPSSHSTFLLITSKIQRILPTILSRCTVLHFYPIPYDSIASFLKNKGLPLSLAKIAHGSIGRALQWEIGEQIKAQLFPLLGASRSFPELNEQLGTIITFIEESKEEDVRSYQRKVQWLFELLRMWYRDQQALQMGLSSDLLFFPDLKKGDFLDPRFEQKLEDSLLAYYRNIKLSSSLLPIFLTE